MKCARLRVAFAASIYVTPLNMTRVVTGFEIEKCEGKRKFLTRASCSDFSRLVCLRPFDKGDYKGRASANREPLPRRSYLPNEKSARSRERFGL